MRGSREMVIPDYGALTPKEKTELRRLLAKLKIPSSAAGAELLTVTVTASVEGVIPQLVTWLHEKALDLIDRSDL
ncbi:MAG: hypothetical protein Q7K03_12145 [Dehalococcoidia bacterium]|nr:hypothetical protein [Dehalococcoidia bacterium]